MNLFRGGPRENDDVYAGLASSAAGRRVLRAPLSAVKAMDGRTSSSGCARRTFTPPRPAPSCRPSTRRSSCSRRSAPASWRTSTSMRSRQTPSAHGAGPEEEPEEEGIAQPTSLPISRRGSTLRLGWQRSRRRGSGDAPPLRRGDGCGAQLAPRSRPLPLLGWSAPRAARVPPARRPTADGGGARAARAAADVLAFASQRIYFVLPDRYANGDPSNDRRQDRGARRPRATTRRTPAGTTEATCGAHRRLHRHEARALRGYRISGFTAIWIAPAVVAAAGTGRQRRVPRLLGSRLHAGRSALRHERGLRRVRRLRPPARAEGRTSTSS